MEDYKKLYEDLVDRIKTMAKAQPLSTKEAIEMHFPEIVESEDERIRKELIAEVKEQIDCIPPPDCRDKKDDKALKRLNKWLTWLEKREQKPAGWSSVIDLISLGYLADFVDNNGDEFYGENKPNVVKWIHSFANLTTPQQEWSEEDDKLYNDLSDTYFYNDEDYPEETYKLMLKRVLDWIDRRGKSFRPQNHWKPSDEQLDALHDAAVYVDKSMFPYPKGILMELHEQLKKLKL